MIKIVHLLSLSIFLTLTSAALAMNSHEDSTSEEGSTKKRNRQEKQTQPQTGRKGVQACERCYVHKIRCNEEKPCQKCVKAGVSCEPRTSFGLHLNHAQKPGKSKNNHPHKRQKISIESSSDNSVHNSHESDRSLAEESDTSIIEPSSAEISQIESEPSREDEDSCDDNNCYPETPHYAYFSGEFLYSMGAIPYYDPSLEDIQLLPGFGGTDQ